MGRPMINPADIDDQELVNALRVLAVAILFADGDRDHSNNSGLSVGQTLVLRDAILCAASKLEDSIPRATAYVEHHPENGIAPYIVFVETEGGGKLSFAYPTRDWAEQKKTALEREWAGRSCTQELPNEIVGS